MPVDFDAIVIGARCAGSPTAMLLARRGHRVLLVDRASFPSDTLSTHLIHAPGVAALRRWGLADRVAATGCPAIETYSFDFGPFVLRGTPRPADGCATAYAPRRTVLDKILVDAAAEAGADVRERFTVEEVVLEDGIAVGIRGRDDSGERLDVRAQVVIGADGSSSRLARAVGATTYHDKPMLQTGAYTYWSDLPVDGMENFIRPDRGGAAFATNDGLTLLVLGWPAAEGDAFRADVEDNYLRTVELVPHLAGRLRRAHREDRFHLAGVANFFRQPYGPGWVLAGDAGYTKDPITAQGISDAFADAERIGSALDAVLRGDADFADAMAACHAARDAQAMPIYEFTTDLARMEPPPEELRQLLGAVAGDQAATDDFVSLFAGTVSPADFFDPANVGRILAATPVP